MDAGEYSQNYLSPQNNPAIMLRIMSGNPDFVEITV